MKTRPSIESIVYLINYLIDNDDCTVQEAIDKAKVPTEMLIWVKTFFSPQIEISSPSILEAVALNGIIYCEDPDPNGLGFNWDSFNSFLLNQRKWNPAAIKAIDVNSSAILKRLPDPRNNESFATRGLVIGHVQSGKTANMAALIAKASDRGYKFFIILAGLFNDLRAQTQKRLDQEITGFSDNETDYPCVIHSPNGPKFVRLTQSGLQGDFRAPTFNDLSLDTIKFAVIKKNVRILTSLNDWLRKTTLSLSDLPVLIIDDEADQATINSNYGKFDDEGNPIDPSATNLRIRELVQLFPKCSYIGFTATPFANLLIDKDISQDLYPRSFIVDLPEPPGYLGARQLFGLGMSPSVLSGDPIQSPVLEVIRPISPKEHQDISDIRDNSEITTVIESAIISYLLASCARVERDQSDKHFSMFIHPSHISNKQEAIKSAVINYVNNTLKTYIKSGPKRFSEFHNLAKRMWEEDFIEITKAQIDGPTKILEFKDIWKHALQIVESIEVKSLNYLSSDTADFSPNHPRRFIVVGGNRLSRGLTIEGLSTSLFLRDTPYFDTLLQMGRWFGFRPGYEDLTRIYVEESIAENFADLARVELELREDIKKYSQSIPPVTPLDLAPLIRDHHEMYVTARNKMGAGRPINPWLAGQIKQTVTFPTDNIEKIRANTDLAKSFVKKIGLPIDKEDGYHGWTDVPSQEIILFLQSYIFGDGFAVNSAVLTSYITKMNTQQELRKWDIFLPAGSKTNFSWGSGIEAKTIQRSPLTQKSIGVLSSASDLNRWKQAFDRFSDNPDRGCLMLYALDGKHVNSTKISFYKGIDKPDIVGIVLIFPNSKKIVPSMYVSQDYQ